MIIGTVNSSQLTTKNLTAAHYLDPCRRINEEIARQRLRIQKAEKAIARLQKEREELENELENGG